MTVAAVGADAFDLVAIGPVVVADFELDGNAGTNLAAFVEENPRLILAVD